MSPVDPELKSIEERLSELEQAKQFLLKRRQQLLASDVVSDRVADAVKVPASTHEKVALFGSLFRGREDVHAMRWENNEGRHGYALACDNEWRQGICHKPKIKCGECRYKRSGRWIIRLSTSIYPASEHWDSIRCCLTKTPGFWHWISISPIGSKRSWHSAVLVGNGVYLARWSAPALVTARMYGCSSSSRYLRHWRVNWASCYCIK